MVAKNGLRPFRRDNNGLFIHLRLDEWPKDVPLQKDSEVVSTGAGPFMPYWHLVFEPDQTIEVVVGWFRFTCSLEETLVWHQIEMEKSGWIRDRARGHKDETSAGLNFQQPETGVKVEMSLRWWKYLNQTSIMIRRVARHPWSPTADEQAAEAPEFPLPDRAGIGE